MVTEHLLPISAHVLPLGITAAKGDETGIAGVRKVCRRHVGLPHDLSSNCRHGVARSRRSNSNGQLIEVF